MGLIFDVVCVRGWARLTLEERIMLGLHGPNWMLALDASFLWSPHLHTPTYQHILWSLSSLKAIFRALQSKVNPGRSSFLSGFTRRAQVLDNHSLQSPFCNTSNLQGATPRRQLPNFLGTWTLNPKRKETLWYFCRISGDSY